MVGEQMSAERQLVDSRDTAEVSAAFCGISTARLSGGG